MMANLLRSRLGIPTRNAMVQPVMFLGEGAIGAPLTELERAKQLLAGGAAPEQAYVQSSSPNATGWFQGADGRWRFEISDADAALDDDAFARLGTGETIKPSELLRHPQLFAAYPDLDKIKLGFVSNKDYEEGTTGYFDPRTNQLKIPPNKSEALQTILHEIQHAIQDTEKFSPGGSSVGIKSMLGMDAIVRRVAEESKASGILDNFFKEDNLRRNAVDWSDPTSVSEYQAFFEKGLADAKRKAAEHKAKYAAPLEKKLEELDPGGRWGDMRDYELYKRLAGETEARNVENRLLMDLNARRQSFPGATQDYPYSEQYVRLRR